MEGDEPRVLACCGSLHFRLVGGGWSEVFNPSERRRPKKVMFSRCVLWLGWLSQAVCSVRLVAAPHPQHRGPHPCSGPPGSGRCSLSSRRRRGGVLHLLAIPREEMGKVTCEGKSHGPYGLSRHRSGPACHVAWLGAPTGMGNHARQNRPDSQLLSLC